MLYFLSTYKYFYTFNWEKSEFLNASKNLQFTELFDSDKKGIVQLSRKLLILNYCDTSSNFIPTITIVDTVKTEGRWKYTKDLSELL